MRSCFCCIITSLVAQEYFSSNEALKELNEREGSFLDEFQMQLDKRLAHLMEIMEQIETIKNDKGESIDHPIDQYKLIRRFSHDWPELVKGLSDIGIEVPNMDDTPNDEDLGGSIDGILRLQDVYNLDSYELANGLALGTDLDSYPLMNADECFTIGKKAYWNADYYHCTLWMEAAWLLIQGGDESAGDGADVLDYFSFSLSQRGDIEQARDMTLQLIELRPNERRFRSNLEFYTKSVPMVTTFNNNFTVKHLPKPEHEYEYRNTYERQCRGEGVGVPKELHSQLTCFYHHGRLDNVLAWAPVKTEILYPNPLIVQFYDVISDAESELVRNLANAELKRATIRDPATGLLTTAHYRVQKTAWLKEDTPLDTEDVVRRYNARIGAITGLNMETAELLQMGNYGVGGQYEPHWDHQSFPGHVTVWDPEIGSRVATWLTYLSQPNMGGGTIFLRLNIQAQPIKNSAVFWYNHLPNGESDDETHHAACPVLSGTKWVSNKWFHIRGQEFYGRPCPLDKDQPNTYL